MTWIGDGYGYGYGCYCRYTRCRIEALEGMMGWDGVDGVVRVERVYQMALKSVYSRRTMGCLYLFIYLFVSSFM